METLPLYQSPLAQTHLTWLEDSQPQGLEQLYRQGKLKSYLERIVNQAQDSLEQLQKEGRNSVEALEVVSAALLAPLPSPEEPPHQPLPPPLLKEIRDFLGLN